ncbi:MAG: PmoA family protein [Balneolales bacterium]
MLSLSMTGANLQSDPETYTVTVSAGAFDRTDAIVSFPFPHPVDDGVYVMENNSNDQVCVQVSDNEGQFILKSLNAGTSSAYKFVNQPVSGELAGSEVSNQINTRDIAFQSGGKDVLSYFHSKNELPDGIDQVYQRGGYIHPVYTPQGTRVTNHMSPGREHHYGIWSAWPNTEFQGRTPDFWNVQSGTGHVIADSLDQAWEGPVHGGFRARHQFIDVSAPEPTVALNEHWKVNVYASPEDESYNLFDLALTQTANTGNPLLLPEYRYGGMAFRGHGDWNEEGNRFFFTSEGYIGHDGDGTLARWTHMGGYVDGELAGFAVLGHPGNYRSPQPARIPPGEPYFTYSPVRLGDITISPGEPYTARFRIITYDGEPDPQKLDRLWNDYAYPPGVTVTE